MKILILSLLIAATAFAGKGDVGLRKSVQLFSLNTAVTTVTSAAWVQIGSSSTYACSGFMIGNSGDKVLQIAQGGAGSEVSLNIAVQNSAIIVPAEISKSTRLALKSINGDQTSGVVHISCLQ